MKAVYVQGTRVRLTPRALVGQGGEAEVYRLDGSRVVKVWKTPDHPDFRGQPALEAAVAQRIATYTRKLDALPPDLPAAVVRPQAPATDTARGGPVRGFAMEHVKDAEVLARYADPRFRQAVDPAQVVARLLELEGAVGGIHAAGAVIGDFNDYNVLVRDDGVRLIDVDSYQLPGFPSAAYTVRTVDPLLCDPAAATPVLCQPYGPEADWYAFTVLAMRCLLLVDPYGGVYRPRARAEACSPEARILRRITVFHPEVRYPKPALPLETLPDALLHHLHRVFTADRRGAFPRALLEALAFTTCAACGRPHARRACPSCQGVRVGGAPVAAPAAPRGAPAVVRGGVVVERLAHTAGTFLAAAWQEGRLRWLAHEDGRFRREDGRVVLEGPLHPRLRFALAGDETLVGAPGRVVRLTPGGPPRTLAVDDGLDGPAFATAGTHLVWAEGGRLWADDDAGAAAHRGSGARGSHTLAPGPLELGEILAGQGQFWLGPRFGLGYYRAGALSVYYLFHPGRRGLTDTLALPPLTGALRSAHGILSDRLGWLVTATQAAGRQTQRAAAITARGAVAGLLEADPDGGDEATRWLASTAGACAVGDALFVPTDEGVVRVEVTGGALGRTRTFADTEPFVDRACTLQPVPGGIAVITPREIRRLTIA